MPKLIFQPFPRLQTKRLILRQIGADDEQVLFQIRSDEQVNKYLERPPAKSLTDVHAFIEKINKGIAQNECIYWGIDMEDQLIGTICLWSFSKKPFKAEIGFELHPDFQGSGFMQEALEVVLDFGFNRIGLERIEGFTSIQNQASIKLMKKNRFKKTKIVSAENAVVYALKKENYKPPHFR